MIEQIPDFIKEKEDGTGVIITLHTGYLMIGTDTRLKEVEMREPMVKDQMAIRKISNDDVVREQSLLASLTGLTPAEFETMTARDYARVQAGYNFFMD